MKTLYTLLLSFVIFACSSDREVKKMTDKGFEYIVEKYLDQYDANLMILKEEISEADAFSQARGADSISKVRYEQVRFNYLKFVTSDKNIKMIKSALEKKESLKEKQIKRLEKMLREAKAK